MHQRHELLGRAGYMLDCHAFLDERLSFYFICLDKSIVAENSATLNG